MVRTISVRTHVRPLTHRRRAGLVAAVALVALVMAPLTVLATGSLANSWKTVYPKSTSFAHANATGKCLLCHGPAGKDTFNPYGWAIRNAGASKAAIKAVAGRNSDGDPGGATNLTEIRANAQPGWRLGRHNTIFNVNGTKKINQPVPAGIKGPIDPP